MTKSWMDRRPSEPAERRYTWSRDPHDLSWIVRTVRAATGTGTTRFARLVGSNHTSIVYCERRQRALRAKTLERILEVAKEHGVQEVLPYLEAEILLACKRAEKGGWR